MKHADRRHKDATMRHLFTNHRMMWHGPFHNKVEHHKHYKLGLDLGYKDAKAGTEAHRHRYTDTFYRAGYHEAMRQWGNVARHIREFQYTLTPRDNRPATRSRRQWRKFTRSHS